MTRPEAAHELCVRITTDIAEITPPALGRCPEAWELVADADIAFCFALSQWTATGGDLARERVRVAYDYLLDAWRGAAEAYGQLGAA